MECVCSTLALKDSPCYRLCCPWSQSAHQDFFQNYSPGNCSITWNFRHGFSNQGRRSCASTLLPFREDQRLLWIVVGSINRFKLPLNWLTIDWGLVAVPRRRTRTPLCWREPWLTIPRPRTQILTGVWIWEGFLPTISGVKCEDWIMRLPTLLLTGRGDSLPFKIFVWQL